MFTTCVCSLTHNFFKCPLQITFIIKNFQKCSMLKTFTGTPICFFFLQKIIETALYSEKMTKNIYQFY